jgi:hypothetical protein
MHNAAPKNARQEYKTSSRNCEETHTRTARRILSTINAREKICDVRCLTSGVMKNVISAKVNFVA